MIELQELSFKGIRRFVEKQTIDFSNRNKLVQIDGRNENTGGSSGAGKSTIFLALDYLLGISDIPATTLQSRLTKDPIHVRGVFKIGEDLLVVTRSKKEGLVVEYRGELVSGNSKLAEEKLNEIIGIPRSVFKKMIHKKQKEGGFFMDMTGKQTYEFLTSVLGIGKYIEYLDTIRTNNQMNTKDLELIVLKIQTEINSIEDLEYVLSKKQKPKCEYTAKDLDSIKNKLTDAKNQKAELEKVLEAHLSKAVEPRIERAVYEDSAQIEVSKQMTLYKKNICRIEEALQKAEKALSEFPLLRQQAMHAGPKIKELKFQLADMERSICPTCKQSWVTEEVNKKIKLIKNEINQLTSQALDIKNKLSNEGAQVSHKHTLQKELSKNKENLEALEKRLQEEHKKEEEFKSAQLSKHYELLAEFNKQQELIKKEYGEKIGEISQLVQNLSLEYSEKNMLLNSYNSALKNYEQEVQDLADLIQKKNAHIGTMEKQRAEIKNKLEVSLEASRLIKTYTLQTFQETLDAIGDVATQILSGIPNMANSTIYFEGCKENKDGSIKDEVTGILNVDGEVTPIKSLSGGERTAIDLAVDFAVIDVIESRAGKGANFYIIDEPFDGLDAVCRENCLEILKQIDTNKKIIMVDHSTELKEMVNDVITVVRVGEFSTIAS